MQGPSPIAQPGPPAGEAVVQVPLARIVPNPRQPRRHFAQEQIQALAQSIGAQGVIQPLVVRPHPERAEHFELIAGERRLRALTLLGWPTAPALVRNIPDEALLEAALVENLQREQLTPIEEAAAYRTLLDEYGYTQETLARRVGKDRSTIANMVRLLGLPPQVRQDLEEGRLSVGHARALLAADPARVPYLRGLILAQGLNVRAVEALVNRERQREAGGAEPSPARPAAPELHPRWQAVQQRLERRLGTRVTLQVRGDGSGSVGIEFYDDDDFNRIYDLLRGR
jgi:ParB family chromosome partitioning protein